LSNLPSLFLKIKVALCSVVDTPVTYGSGSEDPYYCPDPDWILLFSSVTCKMPVKNQIFSKFFLLITCEGTFKSVLQR
jgi:hypothetical protein